MATPSADGLYPRYITSEVTAALRDTPVVAINGPRQVGKSTLVTSLLDDHDGEIVTLDDATQLLAAQSDPPSFVDSQRLLVIDEVQRAPELLPAVKVQVDRDRRPGRYVLTGSTRLLATPEMSRSLAGRVAIIDLWPLSQGELSASRERFIDALFEWELELRQKSSLKRQDYYERVCAGGMPEPLTRAGQRRSRWYQNYASTVVQRMVAETADIDRLGAMPRLLALCAARTANELNVRDIADDLNVPYRTVGSYLTHLETVYMITTLPAWSRNLTSKVVRRPKMMVVDSGLAAHLLRVDPTAMLDPTTTVTGQLLETFVAMELRKQQGWAETDVQLFHFRDRDGAEVDIVLEARNGRVAGIEVKASATVRAEDFKGLRLLEDRLGKRFVGGVVLYTGTDAVPFGKRLAALPVAALWQAR